ncbi:MAG: hypothetical protein ACTS4V_00575 [Candidatus Hodgkinia cicadicola]
MFKRISVHRWNVNKLNRWTLRSGNINRRKFQDWCSRTCFADFEARLLMYWAALRRHNDWNAPRFVYYELATSLA